MILYKLGEFDEFAEALFGQLAVEINEEKEDNPHYTMQRCPSRHPYAPSQAEK